MFQLFSKEFMKRATRLKGENCNLFPLPTFQTPHCSSWSLTKDANLIKIRMSWPFSWFIKTVQLETTFLVMMAYSVLTSGFLAKFKWRNPFLCLVTMPLLILTVEDMQRMHSPLEDLGSSLVFVQFRQEEFCTKNLQIYQKYKRSLNQRMISNRTSTLWNFW